MDINPTASSSLTRRKLAEQLRLSRPNDMGIKQSRELVDLVLNEIVSALSQGHGVEFRGVFCLRVVQVGARQGKNPVSGETVHIPARKRVKFRLSEDVKLPV